MNTLVLQMNDRYKVLAEEAREWCSENADTFDTMAWQWERKFTELILKDVIRVCDKSAVPFEDYTSHVIGATVCREMIKEYFGITK